ncbi:hypothetical protein KCP78_12865 [Salmonella enterica subsp. enterica]|nr:hypothetical protein KCP78_12865 [Salmonella enterica subsp. enterica]
MTIEMQRIFDQLRNCRGFLATSLRLRREAITGKTRWVAVVTAELRSR